MSKGKQAASDGPRPNRPPGVTPAAGGRPLANGSAERPLSEAERSLLRQLQNVKRELGTLVESLEAAEGVGNAKEGSEQSAAADAAGPSSSSTGDGRAAAGHGEGEQETKENMGAAGQLGRKGHPKGGLPKAVLRPPSLALRGAGGLHVAMVKERIKGLLSQRKHLEGKLRELRDLADIVGAGPARNGERPAPHQPALGASSGARNAGSGGIGGTGRAQGSGTGNDPAKGLPPKGLGARNGLKGADAARRGRDVKSKAEAAPVGRSGDGGAVGLVEGDDLDLELGMDDQPAQLVETERDRLIRTGAITPFDRLQGFAKSVVRGQAGPEPGSRQQGSGRQGGAHAGESAGTGAGNRGITVGASSAGGAAGSGDGALPVSERRGLDILERARADEEPRLRTKILEPHEVPKERVIPEYEFGAMFRRSSAAAQKRKRSGTGKGKGKGRMTRPQPSKEWRKRRRAEERREEVREFLESDVSESGSGSEDEYSPEDEGQDDEVDEEEEEGSGQTGSSEEESDRQGAGRRNGTSHRRRASGGQRAAGRGARGSRGRGEGVGNGEVEDDVILEGGLKIPGAVYRRLFEYQRTAVRWMWELHCQEVGGILGDEMGLGKTVQVAAFLGALHNSGLFRPSLIVCPVTLLRQWARELRKWCPGLRPTILHSVVGKGGSERAGEGEDEEEEEEMEMEEMVRNEGGDRAAAKARRQEKRGRAFGARLKKALRHRGSVVLTTYEQIRTCQDWVLPESWGYVILDEGHKIRNPDAGVTLACKQLRTPHRLLLTGCPIQNRLSELWSLLDFAYPGRLGTLPVFSAEFAQPISLGGYASASGIQVSTAYRCALYLRDIILPYLLRRVKKDVALQLPKKTEHVLLCKLTDYQRRLYRAFLGSEEVSQILDQRRNMLYGIDILRKVCNHPDLVTDADGWEGHDRDWVQQAQHEARIVAASASAGGVAIDDRNSTRGKVGNSRAGTESGGRESSECGRGRDRAGRDSVDARGGENGTSSAAARSGVTGSERGTGAGALVSGGRDRGSAGGARGPRDVEASGKEPRGKGNKDRGRAQGAPPAPQGVAPFGSDPRPGSRSRSCSPLPVPIKEERGDEEANSSAVGQRFGRGDGSGDGHQEVEEGTGRQAEGGVGRGGEGCSEECWEEESECGPGPVAKGAEPPHEGSERVPGGKGPPDERSERAARRKWDPLAADEEDDGFVFGDPRRSAKLQVAQKILEQWREEGHKALVFCQTQQMLDILEALVVRHAWVYRRMDGSTPVGQRSILIDEFNSTTAATKAQAIEELGAARGRVGARGRARSDAPEWDDDCMEEPIFVFLLTTRVGGLGTNLTAANRVLIFDPDWNPSTDLQARERAWRIGQQREVVIYRLLTKGTIEEKVYQRQIVKQQLSSRVLKDPRQRRLFKERDVREIFKLADGDEDGGLPVCHPDNPLQGAVVVGGPGHGGEAEGGGDGEEGGAREGEEQGPDSGASILKKLFDGKDIYAALDHGTVEKLAGDIPQWATERAAEAAARAAQALRDSHALRSNSSVAEPTWTGRSGSAGIPNGSGRRFGATTVVRPRQPDPDRGPSGLSTPAAGIRLLPGVGSASSGSGARSASPLGGTLGVPEAGSGVRPSGMAVSSADLLSRLRERRLAAVAGGRGLGDALAVEHSPRNGAVGAVAAPGIPGVPSDEEFEARIEREVVAMLRTAGEQGLGSLQIVTRLGAVLGERGQDAGAMRRVLERVARRKQGLAPGDVRWVQGPQ